MKSLSWKCHDREPQSSSQSLEADEQEEGGTWEGLPHMEQQTRSSHTERGERDIKGLSRKTSVQASVRVFPTLLLRVFVKKLTPLSDETLFLVSGSKEV